MNPNRIEIAYRKFVEPLAAARQRLYACYDDKPDELVEYRPKPDRYLRERSGKLPIERVTAQGIKRREALRLLMKPGEIPLKQFVMNQAEKLNVSQACIRSWIDRGQLKLKLRRINQRVVFVRP